MAVLHEKLDAVLFGRDGIGFGDLDDLDLLDVDLVAAGDAGRTRFRLDAAGDLEAALLGKLLDLGELLIAHIGTKHDGLADAGAIAHLEKLELAFTGLAV